ncbi:methylated-DNA--[protein]-cysteine S-methyltransferase [bacterium]|nr:methylated-DNA--[protein]-cysteine S-methyltransferase [bacterium]
MAGEKIPIIFCWEMEIDDLNIFLGSSQKGVVRIGISMANNSDSVDFFEKNFPDSRVIKDELMNRSLADVLKSLLMGKKMMRKIVPDIKATPFQRMVLEKIADIPFGQTRTYGEVATLIGCPGGARAVGRTMSLNPLPLIYP